jgi:hypothetical protein
VIGQLITVDYILLNSLKIPSIEEEQTTQLPKEKNTKGQTTIYKSYTYN